MIIYLAPLICLIGLFLFLLPVREPFKQLGFGMFVAGLAASLVLFGGGAEVVHALPHR